MTDEAQEPKNNNPGYKSRAVLQTENDELKAGLAALMARMEALESAPRGAVTVDGLVEALKADRESALSAKLQRELDEARQQIEHLQRPQTPTSGVPYSGWVQAKEDLWDGRLIRKGPHEGQPGEIFQIELPDYWPGCPFTPVIVKGQDADGRYITAPHPDFQSH